jgi:hypothetical protein
MKPNTDNPARPSVKRLVRRSVAFVLKRIYGVRGSLKPPLGGPRAGLLYPVRYRAWKLTIRLYHWSGLPAQWHAWYDANR